MPSFNAQRNLIIIRGLPGSGKTTIAKLLTPHNVAADEYFEDEKGNYQYDREKLNLAHDWCLHRAKEWMKEEIYLICVHNTFAQNIHIYPYVFLAKRFDYSLHVIKTEQQFKSIHNVPEKSMQRMRARWENLI